MEKKRPLGVTIFAILLFGFAILRTSFLFMYFRKMVDMSLVMGPNVAGSGKIYYPAIASLIPGLFFFGLLTGISFGILRLKKWAYYLLLGFSTIFLFLRLFALRGVWQYIHAQGFNIILFESALVFAFYISILIYFSRKKVRERFLEGEGLRDDKWSLALFALGWILIFNGVKEFSGAISFGFDFSLPSLVFGWVYHLAVILCGVGFLLKREFMRKFAIGFAGFTILVAFFGFTFKSIVLVLVFNGLMLYFLTRPKVKEKFLA